MECAGGYGGQTLTFSIVLNISQLQGRVDFTGHRVVRTNPGTVEQADILAGQY